MKLAVLDIGGTSIKSAVWEDEKMSRFAECRTEAERGGKHVVEKAIRQISEMGSFDGIGISTAGQVDPVKGSIRYANDNIPRYTGIKLKEIMERTFRVPTAVENDVNAAAIGEGRYGAARGWKDYLCLTYGTGVGGALVMDGQVYRGMAGSAGEFGSMVIHGRDVIPGKRISGCYEDYASTRALVEAVHREIPEITNGREVFENLENPTVKKLVAGWIQEISHGLVTLIHIFNPGCVILGGGIMEQTYLLEAVKHCVRERIMSSFADVEIRKAKLGNTAGLWGVSSLAKKAVLKENANIQS